MTQNEYDTDESDAAPLAVRPSDALRGADRDARMLAPTKPELPATVPAMMSDDTGRLWQALARAQMAFAEVKKTRQMVVRGEVRYSYANLSDIVNAVMPALKAEGFVCAHIARGNRLHVRLIHAESDQWIEGVLPFVPPTVNGPEGVQALGSLLTYLRRYLLSMLLGVVAVDDDDDGAAAMASAPEQPAPAARPARRPAAPEPDAWVVDPLLARLKRADGPAISAVWAEALASADITPKGCTVVRIAAITRWTEIAETLADCDGIAKLTKEQGFPTAAERRLLDALNVKAKMMPDEEGDGDPDQGPDNMRDLGQHD